MAEDTKAPPTGQAPVEPHLASLGDRFLGAMEAVRRGDVDRAADELRAILRVEPRLAEPRIELARLLLDTGQDEEAVEQAQEAVSILESGGQWTEELPEAVVRSVAWDIRGEALRRQADRDEIVFGDPERFKELLAASREAFRMAAELDPDNAHARYWAGGTDSELVAATDDASGEDNTDPLFFAFGGQQDDPAQ